MRKLWLIGISFCLTLAMPLCFITPSITANSGRVKVYFYYTQSCEECRYIKENFLPKLQQKYQHCLEIKPLEITNTKNFQTLIDLEQSYQRPIDKTPPLVVIGTNVLEGKLKIQSQLEPLIRKYLNSGGVDWPQPRPQPHPLTNSSKVLPKTFITNFKALTPWVVIGGGLLDGINPCAFATLIFLISYLTMLGKKGKELIFSGAFFTVGVFCAYFLIGYGLLELFNRFAFFTVLGRLINTILAGILGLLALLSLYDYILVKQGRLKETKLQLSGYLKQKIHAVIRARARTRSKTYLVASFVMGFLVACLEFPCTGQIYFPIIFVLRGTSILKSMALFYLLIYNIMFILPLLGVFGLVYWGVTSEQIAKIMLKHVGSFKLLTALFFGALAILLLVLH